MLILLSLACSPEYLLRDGHLWIGDVFETATHNEMLLTGLVTRDGELGELSASITSVERERQEAQAGPQLLVVVQEDRQQFRTQWGPEEPEEWMQYSHLEGEQLLTTWNAQGEHDTRFVDPEPSPIKLEALADRLAGQAHDKHTPVHPVPLGESWSTPAADLAPGILNWKIQEDSVATTTLIQVRRQAGKELALLHYTMSLSALDQEGQSGCFEGQGEALRDLDRDVLVSDDFQGSLSLTTTEGEALTGSLTWSTRTELVAEGVAFP